jgi:2-polyprenyl-6-methoxyphenol hydroxylase-like FAD-dependent oxidoreductase
MFMENAERAGEAMDVIAAGGGPAGLMTAALLDAAGVRAEACERGSEPARQSRGTAMHPRTLEVLTMIDAGDGRRISDVLLAQGRRVPGHAPRRAARPARLPRPGHAVPVHADAPAVGAEHALAVYLDARGVRVRHGAEVTAAGQSTDEAHVQVSGARHTARYLAGTDGAHNMVRKAAGIGFGGGVPDQVGWVGDVQLAGPVEHARHHWHQEPGHANMVPLGGSAARVYGTQAGDSQLPAGQARRQKAPFSLAGPSATLTGISGIGFGADSPSWLARTTNTGRRDAASPA